MATQDGTLLKRLSLQAKRQLPEWRFELEPEFKRMKVFLPNLPNDFFQVFASPSADSKQDVLLFLILRPESLRKMPHHEVLGLVALENLCLRGVSLDAGPNPGEITIRTGFSVVPGRPDEDVEQVLAGIRQMEKYSGEFMSRLLSLSGPNGILEYDSFMKARIEKGMEYLNVQVWPGLSEESVKAVLSSLEEFFAETSEFQVAPTDHGSLSVFDKETGLEVIVNTPGDLPLLTAFAYLGEMDFTDAVYLTDLLNSEVKFGHFEVIPGGVGFVSYVRMTEYTGNEDAKSVLNDVFEARSRFLEESAKVQSSAVG